MAKKLSTAEILAAARCEAAPSQERAASTMESCPRCDSEISRDNRVVYRGLCLNCYRTSKLPCDECAAPMSPETHRENDGLCFDCFSPTFDAQNNGDRIPAIELIVSALSFDLPESYVQFLRTHDGH
jgi:Zn finger protein HypA/HybF involved in hydrogenase expression